MLPFLKGKKEASISVEPEVIRLESDTDEEFDSVELAIKELIDAIHSKDFKSAAMAFKAAFQLCDEEPHVEGPHIKE